jgi:integrase
VFQLVWSELGGWAQDHRATLTTIGIPTDSVYALATEITFGPQYGGEMFFIPSWPGVINSNKGRIHLRRPTCHAHFLLATERRTIHSGWVFASTRVPGANVTGYRKAWEKALTDAGISGRRMHDWRATFASRANAAHATSLTLAHLLGHSSTTVLPTYTKPLDEHTRSVILALDAARASSKSDALIVQ